MLRPSTTSREAESEPWDYARGRPSCDSLITSDKVNNSMVWQLSGGVFRAHSPLAVKRPFDFFRGLVAFVAQAG